MGGDFEEVDGGEGWMEEGGRMDGGRMEERTYHVGCMLCGRVGWGRDGEMDGWRVGGREGGAGHDDRWRVVWRKGMLHGCKIEGWMDGRVD